MWIDVDEVLNEYRMAILDIARKVLHKEIDLFDHPGTSWDVFDIFTPEENKILFEIAGSQGFCWSLPIRAGSQEAVEELRRHVDLFVVTSPFDSRHWVYERDAWLEKHFGFKRHEHVVHTAAKYLVDADICLDDKPSNVYTWHEHHPHGLAMVWPTFHTRNIPVEEQYRVRDWAHVIERVKNFSGTRHYDLSAHRQIQNLKDDLKMAAELLTKCGICYQPATYERPYINVCDSCQAIAESYPADPTLCVRELRQADFVRKMIKHGLSEV
jgi:5'(3')-deoxyribonucleotidase